MCLIVRHPPVCIMAVGFQPLSYLFKLLKQAPQATNRFCCQPSCHKTIFFKPFVSFRPQINCFMNCIMNCIAHLFLKKRICLCFFFFHFSTNAKFALWVWISIQPVPSFEVRRSVVLVCRIILCSPNARSAWFSWKKKKNRIPPLLRVREFLLLFFLFYKLF